MQYTDDRDGLRVHLEAREYRIPADELTRMQASLDRLGEVVRDFPNPELWLNLIHHQRSSSYHVEARLKLPGKTFVSGDEDAYLDSAFQRCVRKLTEKVNCYRDGPHTAATEQARRLDRLNKDVVAPEDPADGPLGQAVMAGDYRAFRTALSRYEEWLRKRVGRWIQRYPQAEALVGDGLAIGDLVEEVYLNAFEHFTERSRDLPLHEWINGLIDPSLKLLLRQPDRERENVSLARTLRDTPM
jgi:hypothetical protein